MCTHPRRRWVAGADRRRVGTLPADRDETTVPVVLPCILHSLATRECRKILFSHKYILIIRLLGFLLLHST